MEADVQIIIGGAIVGGVARPSAFAHLVTSEIGLEGLSGQARRSDRPPHCVASFASLIHSAQSRRIGQIPLPRESLHCEAQAGTGMRNSLAAGARLGPTGVQGSCSSTWIGTETTLGVPQAVETRIWRDANAKFSVKMSLMTAATRPSQSTTGAPDAP
jgi:hypothetical protein